MPKQRTGCFFREPLCRRAFTLIELLAAIVIIAIVISLAVVTVQRVLASGRATVCVANMRQVGMAAQQYASEHNGATPGYSWYYPIGGAHVLSRGTLAPYLDAPRSWTDYAESSLTCPELQAQWPSGLIGKNTYTVNGYCISLNESGVPLTGQTASATPRTLFIYDSVNPAKQAFFFDGLPHVVMSGGETWAYLNTGFRSTCVSYARFPHNGAANVLYLDGHCDSVSRSDFLAHTATSTFWIGR